MAAQQFREERNELVSKQDPGGRRSLRADPAGKPNGTYLAVFEREMAELARIEQIDWSRPAVVGESPLPAGYGFRSGTSGTPTLPAATRCFSRQRSSIWGCGRLPGPVGELEETLQEKQALLQEQESMIAALEQAAAPPSCAQS